MTPNKLNEFVRGFQDEQRLILDSKGLSYSGAEKAGEVGDRLANFKRVAAAMGVKPLQAWLCYFLKHVDSISTYVRTGFESEGFRSRALDVANYAILGAALVAEEQAEVAEANPAAESNQWTVPPILPGSIAWKILEQKRQAETGYPGGKPFTASTPGPAQAQELRQPISRGHS